MYDRKSHAKFINSHTLKTFVDLFRCYNALCAFKVIKQKKRSTFTAICKT